MDVEDDRIATMVANEMYSVNTKYLHPRSAFLKRIYEECERKLILRNPDKFKALRKSLFSRHLNVMLASVNNVGFFVQINNEIYLYRLKAQVVHF